MRISKLGGVVPAIALLLGAASLSVAAHAAPILALDFETTISTTEGGFDSFTSLDKVGGGKTINGVTVQTTGSFFDRVPEGNFLPNNTPLKALLDDFVFTNLDGSTFDVTLTGLTPGGGYEITFYSSDFFPGDLALFHPVLTTTFSPTAGSGADVVIVYNREIAPATAEERRGTGTFTADGTGRLEFEVSATGTGGGSNADAFQRLNGIELASASVAVPEPDSNLVFAAGALLVAFGLRRAVA